jgi:hypothetical protein
MNGSVTEPCTHFRHPPMKFDWLAVVLLVITIYFIVYCGLLVLKEIL